MIARQTKVAVDYVNWILSGNTTMEWICFVYLCGNNRDANGKLVLSPVHMFNAYQDWKMHVDSLVGITKEGD